VEDMVLTTWILVLPAPSSCGGQDWGKVSRAEDIGFSTERLGRITKFFQSDVEKGAIPGAVVLVAREGKLVYLQTVGYQDREKRIAMKPDAIFRIASMTKPITSVAVMMLAEGGKIDLYSAGGSIFAGV